MPNQTQDLLIPPSDEIESVSEFTKKVKYLLETEIGGAWIRGEISNLRRQSSGHVYFSLKDEGSQVSSVMFRNDAFTTKAYLKDLVEHETRFAGRAIQQIYHVDYYKQNGELVVEGDSWCFRTERDAARERGTKYTEVKQKEPVSYSREQIAEIFDQYAQEEVRGARPRYIEDVKVGDKLSTMVKGPMTVTGFIAYAQGWGGLYIRANRMAWKQLRKHPGLGIPDRFGIPDVPERVHWDTDLAQRVGTPEAYDYGPERTSWMSHHLTDWIGDDGFLRNISVKIRRHNPVGDTLFINGEVSRIFEEDGQHYVEVEQNAKNQDGELSVLSTGVVRLPARS